MANQDSQAPLQSQTYLLTISELFFRPYGIDFTPTELEHLFKHSADELCMREVLKHASQALYLRKENNNLIENFGEVRAQLQNLTYVLAQAKQTSHITASTEENFNQLIAEYHALITQLETVNQQLNVTLNHFDTETKIFLEQWKEQVESASEEVGTQLQSSSLNLPDEFKRMLAERLMKQVDTQDLSIDILKAISFCLKNLGLASEMIRQKQFKKTILEMQKKLVSHKPSALPRTLTKAEALRKQIKGITGDLRKVSHTMQKTIIESLPESLQTEQQQAVKKSLK